MKFNLYILGLLLAFSGVTKAQQEITGNIEDYQGGSVEIILPVQEPRIIGRVNQDGHYPGEISQSP